MPQLPRAMCATAISGIPATSFSAPTCCCRSSSASSLRWPTRSTRPSRMPATISDSCAWSRSAFARAPQKSIDYAVMEKTDRAAVVAGQFPLVGYRQLGCAVRHHTARLRRQCAARPGRDHGHERLRRAFRRPPDDRGRRQGPGGGQHLRRRDGGAPRTRAGRPRTGRQAQGSKKAGGNRSQARSTGLGAITS